MEERRIPTKRKMTITQRIDNITRIPASHLGTTLPAPKSVKIELTAKCNYACTFCASSMKLRKKGTMDRQLYERIVWDLRKGGVEELGVFFLGESFLVPWLPEAIKYAKDIGFPYVFLTTNGSLANGAKVAECMAAGLDSLKWSYNYADPEQLGEIANVKTSYFDVVNENIRSAWRVRKNGGYDCGLYASYIEYDGAQGAKMKESLDMIRPYVDELYALPLYNQASYVTDREKEKGWEPIPGNIGRAANPTEPLPCWSCFTEGHVTYDGKLGACCFSHDDRFVVGDLQVQDFESAWNSPGFQVLREAHLAKDVTGTVCERCVIYE